MSLLPSRETKEPVFCSYCGKRDWEYGGRGAGCGGHGRTKTCKSCGARFMQTTGGILPTPGGERWKEISPPTREVPPQA